MPRLTKRLFTEAAKTGDWSKAERIAGRQLAKEHARIDRMRDISPYKHDPLDTAGVREPKKEKEEQPHDLAGVGLAEKGTVDREDELARLTADDGDDREETVRPDIVVRGSAKPAVRRAKSLGIERYRGAGRWVAKEQELLEQVWSTASELQRRHGLTHIHPLRISDLFPTEQHLLVAADAKLALHRRMQSLPAKERPYCAKNITPTREQQAYYGSLRWGLGLEPRLPHEAIDFERAHDLKGAARGMFYAALFDQLLDAGPEEIDLGKKTGRPLTGMRPLTNNERKQLSRARKLIEQGPRLEDLSARLEKFRPAIAA